MRQLTLHITDKKYSFFLQLVKDLDFVKKIEEESTKEQIIKSIRKSVKQINKIKSGKMKGVAAKKLLNQID